MALPAPVLQPAIDLFEAVEPPERLSVDDNVRRAEYPAVNGGLRFGLEIFLHCRIGNQVKYLLPVHAHGCPYIRRHFGGREIASVNHVVPCKSQSAFSLSGCGMR